ncbi:toll-like receptor 2 [Acipenser oxyrinchus oxyrinchus]|uniref:Toll-like receptor 2 n=1 Tax=Acipenser oxyrinchus oxyrinchus TaxID=40147 RepID=A0AAD8CI17_ACIOX|nr:toll-like receptor 2 [Acipenser oxyrinchus oxyrinchus]
MLSSVKNSWTNVLLCIQMTLVASDSISPCSITGYSANCKGLNLDQVPPGLPASLESLDLSFNKLTAITNKDLAHLTQLRSLNLEFNNISHIEDEAFASNALLKELSVFNNSLTQVPSKLLEPLSRLRSLEMSNNLFASAALGEVFSTLRELESLSMGGPLLLNLSREDFLPLRWTPLKKFAIKSASSLQHYDLGTLSVLQTDQMWFDVALDQKPEILPLMLKDLAGKTFAVLRFRNLFEFKYYTGSQDLFRGLRDIAARQLVFFRGKFNENLLRMALLNVQGSAVKDLGLVAIDFARSPDFVNDGLESSVTDLVLDNLLLQDISNPDVLRFDWRFTWLSRVVRLTIRNVNFNYVPCDSWEEMRNAETVTIAGNRLTDEALYNQRCDYRSSMPKLRVLNANANELASLRVLSALTAEWTALRELDVSRNKLGSTRESCSWKQNVTKLVMHHNMVDQVTFGCLPTTLLYLDMSYSNLDLLDTGYFRQATQLQVLLLSGNKIKFLPSGWKSPNLLSLAVDGNSFGLIGAGSFSSMPRLVNLTAGNNPYHCTCDLHAFIQDTLGKGRLNITDWPGNYKCYHPEPLLEMAVAKYLPGRLVCDVRLVIVVSVVTTAAVAFLLVGLCQVFNVPWYLKAMYLILRAQYRARQEQGEAGRAYTYHAFISYSHSDAEWVRDHLLPCLENCDPPYRLCIHERDFQPGKWIIDNIIENIEDSRKVIFVLSRNFVNSEWCNYELYFAHQRAIGKSFNDVILVVKETIDPESLPSKYCKLKKMLSTKTYLEWPSEPKRQAFFWAQMRGVLGKATPTGEKAGRGGGGQPTDRVSMVELPLEVGGGKGEGEEDSTAAPAGQRQVVLPGANNDTEPESLLLHKVISYQAIPIEVA